MKEAPARIELDIGLLESLFTSINQGFCLCEIVTDAVGRPVDYRFLAVNAPFERMTGLVDSVGRTALELVPGLERAWVENYARAALGGETLHFRDRSVPMGRSFDVFAAPVPPRGRFVIVFRDVTREERLAAEREEALARAEALLEELNHRVMNSLGMIAAIIALEARAREPGAGRRALERIGTRVHAVGDLYRTLSAAQRATTVRADEYLGDVVARLDASLGLARVRLEAEIEPLELPTRIAAPLGLVVNELVTNSLKYAFTPGACGRVAVTLRREGGEITLTVADDGRGMAEPAPDQGIGRKLVASFAQQLGGGVRAEAGAIGTAVSVTFPAPGDDDPDCPSGSA